MSPVSVREYLEALRERFAAAARGEKGRLLDEACRTTGYHRKTVIRHTRARVPGRPKSGAGTVRRRGRPPRYGPAVVTVLERLWTAADQSCGKRLQPFLPELLAMLEQAGTLHVPLDVRAQVEGLSSATIDRLLAPARRRLGRRPYTQRRAVSALQALIPVRTCGEWQAVTPGACQADLVAHCGERAAGFSLVTLSVVEVATSWWEPQIIRGKGQHRVGAGLHHVRGRFPLPLRELHTDNGGEFLNQVLYPSCQRAGIRFTRGRAYRKNDQSYVEQKNGWAIRRLVGYDRYSSEAAYAQFQRLYALARLYVNFCQPVRKLVSKERQGAKVVKRYDRARTPYQRVLETQLLDEPARRTLTLQYQRIDPEGLRRQLDAAVEVLWRLADRPGTATTAPLRTVAGVTRP